MGWKLDQHVKQRVYDKQSTVVPTAITTETFDGYILDADAVLRTAISGYAQSVSPAVAAGIIYKREVTDRCKHGGIVIFSWDNREYCPEIRKEFLEKERYADTGAVANEAIGQRQHPETGIVYSHDTYPIEDDDIENILPDSMPESWIRVINNRKAKVVLYNVLIELIKQKAVAECSARDNTVVVDTGDTLWVHGKYKEEIKGYAPLPKYGEADCRVQLWQIRLSTVLPDLNVIISTNDHDIVIGAKLVQSGPVVTGKCFVSSEIPLREHQMSTFAIKSPAVNAADATVVFSRESATKLFRSKYVKVDNIINAAGGPRVSFNRRLCLDMLYKMMGKIDYTNSTNRFRITTSKLLALILLIKDTPFTPWIQLKYKVDAPMVRAVVFSPTIFAKCLRKIKLKKRTKPSDKGPVRDPFTNEIVESIEDFNAEITRVFRSTLYSFFWNMGHPIPGDGLPGPFVFFPGAATVVDAIDRDDLNYPDIFVKETHPFTDLASYPGHPKHFFGSRQLETIQATLC